MTYFFGDRQIFGRETELAMLQEALERVSQTGDGEVVLVRGPTGIGKTALVKAFASAGVTTRFAAARTEDMSSHVPYGPVFRILESICQPGEMEGLALSPDASLSDSPAQLSARLTEAIQAKASAAAPLVIFIDDLQWLDTASAAFLRAFAADGMKNILLIGAIRTDDGQGIVSGQPGSMLEHAASRTTRLDLLSLPPNAVEDMMSSQRFGDGLKPVARLVQSVASGNPFHIRLILRDLSRKEGRQDLTVLLSAQKNWDIQTLMSGHFDQLPEETRQILQLAACIGASSDQRLLAAAGRISDQRLDDLLFPAIQNGLVRIEGGAIQFQHHRLREHVLTGLACDQRARLHAMIACSMIEAENPPIAQQLAAAGHIVNAADAPALRGHSGAMLAVLLKAAQVVKAAGSLDAALCYAEKGLSLLGESEPQGPLQWTFELLRCAILVEIKGAAIHDDALERLAALARSPLDQARALRLKAGVLILRGAYERAISLALDGLACLDIHLSRKPDEPEIAAAFSAAIAAYDALVADGFENAPLLTDEKIIVAMDLLATLQSSFFSDDGLKCLHVAKIVELSARYGVCEASCYGLAWCGVCVAGEYAAYETALGLAEAAVALSKARSFQAYRTSALVALDQVSVWLKPLSYALMRAREAYDHGKRSGDVSMACYAANHVVSDLLAMGAPLRTVGSEIERGLELARGVGFDDVIKILELQQRFVEKLAGTDITAAAAGDAALIRSGSEMSPLSFWGPLFDGIAAFHHGRLETASHFLTQARKWTWTTPGHIHIADLHFHAALCQIMLGCDPGADRAVIAGLARGNPLTFASKQALLDAETHRANGETIHALRCYEQAIEAAGNAGFLHEIAFAHERAGRLSFETGLFSAARLHLRQAQHYYRRWGAQPKSEQIQLEFTALFATDCDDKRKPDAQEQHRAAQMDARADLIRNAHVTILGSMAAAIVHEVNQPLSAIVTYANSGARWLQHKPPQLDKAASNFARIEQAGMRASGIVMALRSLAKQSPANLEFVDLSAIVNQVLPIVERDERAEGVTITCALAADGGLFADSIQIQQIVLNLMTNALDAMRAKSGRRALAVASEIHGSDIRLLVSDTGSGIAEAVRDRIFDPFFSTKDSGLGMGLSICKTIAEIHGGSLGIGQSSAAGTTMVLSLPLTAMPQSAGEDPPAP
ncbi:AAA family ATPase [Martelella sp. HB161492]|uniref:trifunctional serine/threonine-protein kinase/ATP-binding protein/sensor histidine kinase n=1 Tax=Martelella sp. HB161492 TaxID=2720726 RepID=UPI001590AF4D|nr:AAA family ATPase [Martelella sp. HB161492]